MAMWHYAIGTQSFGPVSDEVIRSLATQGVLGPMASILPQGSVSWTPLHVHETSLGLRRTPAGGYVVATPPASAYQGGGTPMPPPPPSAGFHPGMAGGYQPYQPMHPSVAPGGAEFATWWERVGAALIDGLVLAPFGLIVLLFSHPDFDNLQDHPARSFAAQAVVIVTGLLYFGWCHSSRSGQTLGKKAAGIRVVSTTGDRLSRGHAVLRYLVSGALASLLSPVIPFAFLFNLVDSLWPLWDPRNQALHDKVAGSFVVHVQPQWANTASDSAGQASTAQGPNN